MPLTAYSWLCSGDSTWSVLLIKSAKSSVFFNVKTFAFITSRYIQSTYSRQIINK